MQPRTRGINDCDDVIELVIRAHELRVGGFFRFDDRFCFFIRAQVRVVEHRYGGERFWSAAIGPDQRLVVVQHFRKNVLRLAREPVGIIDSVEFRIRERISDGFFHDVDTDNFFDGARERQTDRPRAAAHVQQQALPTRTRPLTGESIQSFGGDRVDLEKRRRGKRKLETAHVFVNDVCGLLARRVRPQIFNLRVVRRDVRYTVPELHQTRL
mmetsp:Transcript_129/g.516  ORF Transcript_129/g.516 Transcript_129/m.516 type:complete len:212 (+) Transcript_129:844-1479(+)